MNVASVIDVAHKNWGADKDHPFLQYFEPGLKNGIKTVSELDNELYKLQKGILTPLWTKYATFCKSLKDDEKFALCATRDVASLGKIFDGADATQFNGMETLKGSKTGGFLSENIAYHTAILNGMVAGLEKFVDLVNQKKDIYFTAAGKTGRTQAYESVKDNATLTRTKQFFKAEAQKRIGKFKGSSSGKVVWKFSGEVLGKKGFFQPYGGFGKAIADLDVKNRKNASPKAIYKILTSVVEANMVIVGNEISAGRVGGGQYLSDCI